MSALVIVGGLPGTGKSTIAEQAARMIHGALIAKDVVEATLWRSGIGRDANSGWVGYELLGSLADAQLRVGGSAVLDSVAAYDRLRDGWREIARRHGAAVREVECVCSDENVHRLWIEGRRRDIPGWYELTWQEVEDVRSRYEPWPGEHLVLDSVQPLEDNLAALEAYVRGTC
ncbi:MAG: ATP-binding protein [Chloroflexota bacterium]|nr:ATP-binding protein [Chloroflexota bacterium]